MINDPNEGSDTEEEDIAAMAENKGIP